MRFAVVATALVLMSGVRAYADPIAGVELPHAPAAFSAPESLESSDSSGTPELVLPEDGTTSVSFGSQSTGVTPEPASFVLLGTGVVLLGGMIWRRGAALKRVNKAKLVSAS